MTSCLEGHRLMFAISSVIMRTGIMLSYLSSDGFVFLARSLCTQQPAYAPLTIACR